MVDVPVRVWSIRLVRKGDKSYSLWHVAWHNWPLKVIIDKTFWLWICFDTRHFMSLSIVATFVSALSIVFWWHTRLIIAVLTMWYHAVLSVAFLRAVQRPNIGVARFSSTTLVHVALGNPHCHLQSFIAVDRAFRWSSSFRARVACREKHSPFLNWGRGSLPKSLCYWNGACRNLQDPA